MKNTIANKKPFSRRDFIKATAGTAAAAVIPSPILAKDPIKIVFWSNFSSGTKLEALEAMVSRFNKENPDIIVKHTGFQNEDYKSTILNTAFAGGQPPDIFTSVGFEWLFSFVREGAVLDITDYYNQNLRQRFIPGIESTYEYGGKYWGVPWGIGGTPFIYYNIDLLEKIGVTSNEINTIEGFENVCDLSLKAGLTPIGFGNKGQWNAVHWISNCVKNIMGSKRAIDLFTMKSGRWDDPEPLEGLNRMKSWVKKNYFGNTLNETYGVGQERFFAGKTLMLGTGGWVVGGLVKAMKKNPKFQADFTEFPVEVGKPGLGSDWIFWGELFAASNTEDEATRAARIRVLDAVSSPSYHAMCFPIRENTYGARGAAELSEVPLDKLSKKKYKLFNNATSLIPIPDVAIPTQATAVMYEEFQGALMDQVSTKEALTNIADAIERFKPKG